MNVKHTFSAEKRTLNKKNSLQNMKNFRTQNKQKFCGFFGSELADSFNGL
jgi:hypothetical protein